MMQRCPSLNAVLWIFAAGAPLTSTAAESGHVSTPFAGPGGEYVTEADQYHTFRIPGMVVAADGTILAFAEGRRGDGDDPRRDENAPIDIVLRRSVDQGETWSPLTVVDTGFRPDGSQVDFGDPTPVVDRGTGTIFLFYGQFPDVGPIYPTVGQDPGATSGNHVIWVRSSLDHGETWSERQQVVYPDEPDETSDGLYWRHAEPGPGSGIQLRWQTDAARNGRLVIPARRAGSKSPEGPVTVEPLVYYSDDQGTTWQVGEPTAGPEANESEVVELIDGRVLLDGRQSEGKFRRRHHSVDGGQTWGPDQPSQIPVTRVDASLARFSAKREGDEENSLLWTAPRGRDGLTRDRLTLWFSTDEGKSFGRPVVINEGFAAYSVAARLSDGTIGILAETSEAASTEGDPYGSIHFYRAATSQMPK